MPDMDIVRTLSGYDFGKELRRFRTRAGLTLRSLAERVAFDYSYLAQVERGVRPGSTTLAYRCDEALGAHGHLVRLFADRKMRQALDEDPGAPVPAPGTASGVLIAGPTP